MTIFYFTSTGNSLAIAKRIGGKLIAIPQVIDFDNLEYEDDVIGLIFPIYSLRPPKMVREFLKRVKLNAKYTFAIGTFGNMAGAAMTNLQQENEELGFKFDYVDSILMVDNYLPIFEINKQIEKIPEKKIEENINRILSNIKKEVHNNSKSSISTKLLTKAIEKFDNHASNGLQAKKFVVDNKCTLCGVCSKVCPSGNIVVSDKVQFNNKCEGCLGCVNLCPQNAMHLKNEKSDKRWINPEVSLKELIEANNRL